MNYTIVVMKHIHCTTPLLSEAELHDTCAALSRGELIIFPTETCYGVGVDATQPAAVTRLLSYKGGRKNKAVSVMVDSKKAALNYVVLNATSEHFYDHFMPGPITVISESRGKVDRRLVNERGGLGVRIPDHKIALQLSKAYGKPITSTSANTSGKKTPYSFSDLERYTSAVKLAEVGLMIDVGTLAHHPPSTVVDTTSERLIIERKGPIDFPVLQTYVSNSPDETKSIASAIVEKYVDNISESGLFMALQGDLGAGKTQFVKGVANFLDIEEPIVSPTYQIMREYVYRCGKVSGKLYHIDAWRLESVEDFSTLGVDKLLTPGAIVVVEWMDLLQQWLWSTPLACPSLVVSIAGDGDESRTILFGEINEKL